MKKYEFTEEGKIRKSFSKQSVILPPPDVKLTNDPSVYRRDLIATWIRSKTVKDLRELVELENMFNLLKGTTEDKIYQKILQGKQLTSMDLAQIKLMKEVLTDLHKLKHGEKKVNVNLGYQTIRDLMFGKQKTETE